MFNDKYGLTDLVLSGQKTQTRRIIKGLKGGEFRCFNPHTNWAEFSGVHQLTVIAPLYHIGKEVAVAMSYKTVYEWSEQSGKVAADLLEWFEKEFKSSAGWTNKMFVKAEWMSHYIKITNIRVERLQDISDDDCMAEGIIEHIAEIMPNYPPYTQYCCGISEVYCDTPRQAFASLIDKINGKGTWESNPYVWAYDFELVK